MKPTHEKTRRLKALFPVLVLLALCACLSGCGDEEEDAVPSPAHPSAWMPV